MPIDPPFWGLWPAQVVDNDDPQGLYRVKFTCPALMDDKIMEWAKPIGTLFGGGIRKSDGTVDPCGMGGAPPVGSAIMVSFVGGDLSFPYYMGGWYAQDPEDATKSEAPNSPKQTSPKGSPKVKIFETGKWRLFFDDDDTTPILRIERKGSEDTAIEINGATEVVDIRSKPTGGGVECFITLDPSSGTITIEGGTKIDLGKTATDALVKGTAFKALFDAHTHTYIPGALPPVVTSPPGVLMDVPPGTHLSAKVDTE